MSDSRGGKFIPNLDNPDYIHDFIKNIPQYTERLSSYRQDGNRKILNAIDEWLDKAAAGIL